MAATSASVSAPSSTYTLALAHRGALALAYQLDARNSLAEFGTLIELPRKEFDGEHRLACRAFAGKSRLDLRAMLACHIDLGLAEHNGERHPSNRSPQIPSTS